ncbi:hypothetical protein LINPERPRIM_LOCUS2227 [Linum perenne]
MLDDVVEKAGEENVIQIVTDNASAYKAAEAKLMEKRTHLFWTPCAAHCLDLMLEDLEKKLSIHKRKSTFSTTRAGKRIQGITLDSRFWTSVLTCLRAAMPLMKVLRLVDSNGLPSMPFLYLELNQAMEKIKSNFSNIEKSPLHYAAYWLNPKVHFGENFDFNERKLKVGLYDCVERLSKDRDERM